MRFTIEERTFIIKKYYESGVRHVMQLWPNEFATPLPSRKAVYNLIHKFERTGSVADDKRTGRPVTTTTAENQERVAQHLVETPETSTRRGGLELDLSHTSYRRIVKRLKFKPYIPRVIHGLLEDDPDRRLQYCEMMLDEYRHDDTLFSRIIFSDEAQFKLNGLVNRHNSVYYDTVNPHITYEQQLNQPGVIVWAGMSSFGMFGPYFFEGNVTGEAYLNMLRDYFVPGLRNTYEQAEFDTCYFQQDGAPPHYTLAVRNYLEEQFQGRVIGRRGNIEWPPRSPDLTPLDFFVWGYVKDMVYAKKPRTLNELRREIENVFEHLEINGRMLKTVIESIPDRLQDCINAGGECFEYLK